MIAMTIVTALLCWSQFAAAGEPAVPAKVFLDSMGVNVHLGFDGTFYTEKFPEVIQRLRELHIRHVRDGLMERGTQLDPYYSRHRSLAAMGAQCDFITTVGAPAAIIQRYPSQVEDMEAVEAPNEFDAAKDAQWSATLLEYLPILRSAVHGRPGMPVVAVIGPSLVNRDWWKPSNSYAQMRSPSVLFDYANLHNYPGGRNPGTVGWSSHGYGSIDWALSQVADTWPGTPVMTTETGYNSDPNSSQFVPDSVSSVYIPRIFLEQFLHGIKRTYLYELADDQFSGGAFGLLHNNGFPKPAFQALANLTALLSDPGPAFEPSPLTLHLSSGSPKVHHLLIQKRSGTFLLLIWLEAPRYDVDTRRQLKVDPENVQIRVADGKLNCRTEWLEDGTTKMTPIPGRVAAATVAVTDRLSAIEIERPAFTH